MLTTTTKLPSHNCPYCGVAHYAATGLEDGDRPETGSVSICCECGELAIFADGKKLRKPTLEELTDIQRSRQWPLMERLMRGIKDHAGAAGATP